MDLLLQSFNDLKFNRIEKEHLQIFVDYHTNTRKKI